MRDLTYALILLLFASCNPSPPEDGSEETLTLEELQEIPMKKELL